MEVEGRVTGGDGFIETRHCYHHSVSDNDDRMIVCRVCDMAWEEHNDDHYYAYLLPATSYAAVDRTRTRGTTQRPYGGGRKGYGSKWIKELGANWILPLKTVTMSC